MFTLIRGLIRWELTMGLEGRCKILAKSLEEFAVHMKTAHNSLLHARDSGNRFKVYNDQNMLTEAHLHWSKRSKQLSQAKQAYAKASRLLTKSTKQFNKLAATLHRIESLPQGGGQDKIMLTAKFLQTAHGRFPAAQKALGELGNALHDLQVHADDLNVPDATELQLTGLLVSMASKAAVETQAKKESALLQKKAQGRPYSIFDEFKK